MKHQLEITDLGGKGDGVSTLEGAPVHIPFTAPGDKITAEVDSKGRSRLREILAPSRHRVEPACPVFSRCGGCSVQHVSPDYIAGWKRAQILAALDHRGFKDPEVAQTISLPAGRRRRAALTLRRTGRAIEIGFLQTRSHTLVPINACPALHPELSRLIPALPDLARPLMTKAGGMRAYMTLTDNGVDLDLTGGREPDGRQRLRLSALTRKLGLARLTLDGETLAEHRKPVLAIGKAEVVLFPGAFLQASGEGEHALQALVTEAAQGARAIADLFCGLGTFTLKLAETSAVHAVDTDRQSLDALRQAANHAKNLKGIAVERRDLMRHPLSPDELKRFDCVVFDPPRAGAETQCRSLIKTGVPLIIAISCNPASFARDAGILRDGGYTLTRVTPVDQFVWSAHIELVGVFEGTE